MAPQEHRICFRKSGIFLAAGLDRANQLDASGENRFYAQRAIAPFNLWMLEHHGRIRTDLPDGQCSSSFFEIGPTIGWPGFVSISPCSMMKSRPTEPKQGRKQN
ncbi:hypothetical protein [Bradyrhizobium sp. ORS 375]|uniref:hypothetical protein n=1 Tax=Bradyrhizobium sp. (strain ORS 375) TaxID=566679 RepID=UPI001112674D|nr:hypothetical protein [Bradyrhizobium sp. ORS 375]